MKKIEESPNSAKWPRQKVKTIECRKRDLIIRIADWTKYKDEPAYDVEIYIGGVYDWNESEIFAFNSGLPKKEAKKRAIKFASEKITALL